MDARELKRRALQAREFDFPVDQFQFRLRVPEEVEIRTHILEARAAAEFNNALMLRMVPVSLIGWEGVTSSCFVDGLDEKEAAEPVKFDTDLVNEFLMRRPTLFDALSQELTKRFFERDTKRKEASKNS